MSRRAHRELARWSGAIALRSRNDELMPITLHAADLTASDFPVHKDLARPSAEVLGDPMKTRALIAFEGEEGKIVSGSWECEPGSS